MTTGVPAGGWFICQPDNQRADPTAIGQGVAAG
jgi:hypothetical protein